MGSKSESNQFKIDRFFVPVRVRAEFLGWVGRTHEFLRHQPGFVRDTMAERRLDDEAGEMVTVMEWDATADLDAVRDAVAGFHREVGFDPVAYMRSSGIGVERATYGAISS